MVLYRFLPARLSDTQISIFYKMRNFSECLCRFHWKYLCLWYRFSLHTSFQTHLRMKMKKSRQVSVPLHLRGWACVEICLPKTYFAKSGAAPQMMLRYASLPRTDKLHGISFASRKGGAERIEFRKKNVSAERRNSDAGCSLSRPIETFLGG